MIEIVEVLEMAASTIRDEPVSDYPQQFVEQVAWPWARARAPRLQPKSMVLDLGCGRGFAIEMFRKEGFNACGVTRHKPELAACNAAGLPCFERDMHDLMDLQGFDLVWARHVLEHSPFPLLVLRRLHDIIVPRGYIYVEVPAGGTDAKHESNPNHFSILTKAGWRELIQRAGFALIDQTDFPQQIPLGQDVYHAFLAERR